MQTIAPIYENAAKSPALNPSAPRSGTKQTMLQAHEGATIEAIIAAAGCQAHAVCGAMSGIGQEAGVGRDFDES